MKSKPRRARPSPLALAVLACTASLTAAQPTIAFNHKGSELRIAVGGQPLAAYVTRDEKTLRPFFKDVYAPGGIRVARNHPPREGDRDDHAALHPGLFLAFGDVSGNDFWRNRARVVHDGYVEKPSGGPGRGSFTVRNRYVGKDGEVVCIETCRYTFLVRPAGYLITWDSLFESDAEDFYFGDQEEMGLAIRVHTPMNVRGQSGRILNASGHRNEKGAWGKTAAWCDYGGTADSRFVGVTLMPDPANFRTSWFHARDYGVLVANPFGRKAFTKESESKVVVQKKRPFHLGFGVLVHAGADESSVDLDRAYADYLDVIHQNDKGSLRTDLRDQPGIVSAEFLYDEAPFPSCHASTIAETEDGLVTAFFGGTGEGNRDVGIWLCRKAGQENGERGWSPPVEVATGVVSASERYPCWNPVLFQAKDGPLLLFYKVGPSPRAWWGMLKSSTDSGKSWSEARRLPESILGPVKNKPVLLPDGALLCGSSTEHAGWRVHFEWTRDLGENWERTEAINDGSTFGAIQPTILVHEGGRLQALCRNSKSPHVMAETWSADGGKTWSRMTPGLLPNPNAGFDAVSLRDGRQLLVYNHSTRATGGRSKLNVAVSDDGKNWKAALVLEDGTTIGGRSAYGAYPAAIQASDGLVHVTYTWRRERISYVVVDPAKLQPREMRRGDWPE